MITLNLSTLLDLLWNVQDSNNNPISLEKRTIQNKDLALAISAADPQEEYCHIEPDSNKLDTFTIWRKKEWITSHDRWLRQKAWSEDNRQRIYLREENLLRLTRAIIAKMPSLDSESAKSMANILLMRAGTDTSTAQYRTIRQSLITMYEFTIKEHQQKKD